MIFKPTDNAGAGGPHGPLVILTALRSELPVTWLKALGCEPVDAQRLMREDWRGFVRRGVLFVITGVGGVRAEVAARWVCEKIDPIMAINIGTAGALTTEEPIFSWVIPAEIRDGSAACRPPLVLEQSWPLAWPEGEAPPIRGGGALVSATAPCTDCATFPRNAGFRLVDMEAYDALAPFAAAGIAHFCIKIVTDYADQSTLSRFKERLAVVRERMTGLLSFLVAPAEPAIAVVIPTYNRAPWLRRCIDSVLGQSLVPREVMVVDDGSTDETPRLLADYGASIQTVTLPCCRGVSHARNTGIAATRAAWLAFLDSDDTWTKDKLEQQWSYLQQNPYFQISQCEEIWIRDGVRVNRCKHHEKKAGFIFAPSLHLCLVSPSAVIMRRTLFDTYGFFDESLPACEDYDMWLRILRDLPVGLNRDPSLVKYGGHEDQLSRRHEAMDRFRISALLSALEREGSAARQRQINTVIARKAKIMAGGLYKRGRCDAADGYRTLAAQAAQRAEDEL